MKQLRVATFLCGLLCTYSLFYSGSLFADSVVWEGKVQSDGSPTAPIKLELNHFYKIYASGVVNLGKWTQAGEKLGTDACFEFNPESCLEKTHALRNSANIQLEDSVYNPQHTYDSLAFLARTNRIHLWVDDSIYDDNNGSFLVKIVKVDGIEEMQK